MTAVLAAAVVAAATLSAPALEAQEREDTLAAPDSVRPEEPAGPRAQEDTVGALPDSLVFRNLPRMVDGAPARFGSNVWEWDREALFSARAQTLLELLESIPGVVALRGGDYGAPEGFSVFGLGGGRYRVFRDGFEMLPLDGAVVDLTRVNLGGVESVRVERDLTEVRIELESLRAEDHRPLSIVEAGTGDFDTNHFRGTFLHPRAFGGGLAVGLERIDTRGPGGAESGVRTGGWLRYTRYLGDRGGVRAEYRSGSSSIEVDGFPPEVDRADWLVRARYRIVDDLVAELFTGGSDIDGGRTDGLTPISGDRRQHGVRASWRSGPLWARGSFRLLADPELPSTALDLEAGGTLEGIGGVAGRWSRESWGDDTPTLASARAWTVPVLGLSGFASWESGERGARIFQPRESVPDEEPDPPEEPAEPSPAHRVTDRTGVRLGASFEWGPAVLAGAWLSVDTDSLLPLGLHTDRAGAVAPPVERTGFEVSGRVNLPVDGFWLYGALHQWDREARYLPERSYQGGIAFHDTFLESRNFELWADVGVEGRDPMLVPVAGAGGLERVPFYQSWNAFIEARIVTLRLVIRWDNFTVRRSNQDYPGRVQTITRATYGIRWTMWN